MLDVRRIKDVMELRGAAFKGRGLYNKIRSYSPLLKIVLISALEGSLERAEALYSKGYGRGRRTRYYTIFMGITDYLMLVVGFLLFLMLPFSLWKKAGKYDFYPVMDSIKSIHVLISILIFVIMWAGIFLLWRYRRWKSSNANS